MVLPVKSKKYFFAKKAQSVLEYTVFIVMAGLVFLAFSTRSNIQNIIQGRWRKDISTIAKEQYRGGVNPSSTSYTAELTEDSIQILQGEAYFDN